ncbi:MAG TPA: SagB family peptide dehydrogenase [Xanthobacteraceae bacterium]|nr:SagB family peptide dehydrogenase [Xanthobacteraceae bacterium]
MRASRRKTSRQVAPSLLSARLAGHVAFEVQPNGELAASFYGHSAALGKFSAAATRRAQDLRVGLPLTALASGAQATDKEMALLVRRLARHGLLEFRLGPSLRGADQVIIEPQIPDYWPRIPRLDNTDTLVLSRFAYMRRRGSELVLESPRSAALFRICNPDIAASLAALAAPQPLKKLRRQNGFGGVALLALLVDCQILFKLDAAHDRGLRPTEGNDGLVLWDFHDLLFHTRSTEGRHANPLGGVYPYATTISPPPAMRSCWSGSRIELAKFLATDTESELPIGKILRGRHSVRRFDDRRPITLAELSRFLDGTARVQSEWTVPLDAGGGGSSITYTARPYPSGGSSHALELYLAVDKCEGLPRGFYYYDAGEHTLVQIDAGASELDALLKSAAFAMGESGVPQILITIAARFGRVSWKYSSIAYSLILKDVGVLTQTFYLMATAMGLGGCAIGTSNIDLFAHMTGIEFYIEGPVGQFALGRGAPSEAAS